MSSRRKLKKSINATMELLYVDCLFSKYMTKNQRHLYLLYFQYLTGLA